MGERKYSLDEIDRMRAAVTKLNEPSRPEVTWSYPGSDGPLDRQHPENCARWRAGIEDQLRTYMLNGTEPDEIEGKVKTLIESVTVGSKWGGRDGRIDIVRKIEHEARGLYVRYGKEGQPHDSYYKLISFAMTHEKIEG